MKIQHIVLTPFNSRLDAHYTKALDLSWLAYRWKLFTEVTVPSMAGQTCLDFNWIVLCHKDSPDWLRDQATLLRLPCNLFFLFGQWDPALEYLKDPSFDAILTSRIDSDDAWHRTAVERIQDDFSTEPYAAEILNFKVGYKYDLGCQRLATTYARSGPFSTKINRSPVSNPLDCGGAHNKLWERYVCRDISRGDPMFVMTVHGDNIYNRITSWDHLLSPSLSEHILREAFGVSWCPTEIVPPGEDDPLS